MVYISVRVQGIPCTVCAGQPAKQKHARVRVRRAPRTRMAAQLAVIRTASDRRATADEIAGLALRLAPTQRACWSPYVCADVYLAPVRSSGDCARAAVEFLCGRRDVLPRCLTDLTTREGLSLDGIHELMPPNLRFFDQPRLRGKMSDLLTQTTGCFLFGGRVCDRDGDQITNAAGEPIHHWFGFNASRGSHGIIYDGTDQTVLVLEPSDIDGANEEATLEDIGRHRAGLSLAAICRRKAAMRVMQQLHLKTLTVVAILKIFTPL